MKNGFSLQDQGRRVREVYSKIMLYMINKDLSNLVKEEILKFTKGQSGIMTYFYNSSPQILKEE